MSQARAALSRHFGYPDFRPAQAGVVRSVLTGQDTLAVVDGAIHLARQPEIVAHSGVDPPESQLIAERLGEGLGAAQVIMHPPRFFSQGIERGA